MTNKRRLDLRGLKCPLPVLVTRRHLADLASGETISVECSDPLAAIDIPHMVAQDGNELIDQCNQGETLSFTIKKI